MNRLEDTLMTRFLPDLVRDLLISLSTYTLPFFGALWSIYLR